MKLTETFRLHRDTIDAILASNEHYFGFNGLGELTFYRSYSRNGESWPECVERVVNGILSIRKQHYKNNGLQWSDRAYQGIAADLFSYIYTMKFLPPGRGLWAMGSEHVAKIGSFALFNCSATEVHDSSFAHDLEWSMDAMMLGSGVGYRIETTEKLRKNLIDCTMESDLSKASNARYEHLKPYRDDDRESYVIEIEDSREGWLESIHYILSTADLTTPFDYSLIRPYGTPIKRFGGTASGPAPLIALHHRLRSYIYLFLNGLFSPTRFTADNINAIGACVVSGNVRRGAQIIIGSPMDEDFLRLKTHPRKNETNEIAETIAQATELSKGGRDTYQEVVERITSLPKEHFSFDRPNIDYLSNNSAALEQRSDFISIPRIAQLIPQNGEPGLFNQVNASEYGRMRQDECSFDSARIPNPCSEIILENKETCNVVEVFPTLCNSNEDRRRALELATFYAQTVSLFPTHRPETNAVVARNRRIGVSITGISEWITKVGAINFARLARDDYKLVRETANKLAAESGVPAPIRCTTVKPSGTISLLAGVASGMHFPTFRYALRRVRLAEGSLLDKTLIANGFTPAKTDREPGTSIYTFPIAQPNARPAKRVSAWEQFALLSTIQREWADNSVSCTIYFDPEREAKQIEHMLGQFVPLIKSVSLLPHSDAGAYELMPYEGISRERYEELTLEIPEIDWSLYREEAAKQDDYAAPDPTILFCDGDRCVIEDPISGNPQSED